MGQSVDLFKISNIGDKNNKKENPTRMGKKENWEIKTSNLNFKKVKEDFDQEPFVVSNNVSTDISNEG